LRVYSGFSKVDNNAAALECGKYFDTVGWVSFDKPAPGVNTWFEYQYIWATKSTLAAAAGIDQNGFDTVAGALFRAEVAAARNLLGVDRQIGCCPRNFNRWVELASDGAVVPLDVGMSPRAHDSTPHTTPPRHTYL